MVARSSELAAARLRSRLRVRAPVCCTGPPRPPPRRKMCTARVARSRRKMLFFYMPSPPVLRPVRCRKWHEVFLLPPSPAPPEAVPAAAAAMLPQRVQACHE